ncbi:MAG: hypothetical protein KDE31_18265, partial [Caldilineaceae bacterium]|nr:hypothetical protein [Caldilineaceae bacterium]
QVLATVKRGAIYDYIDQAPTCDWLQICCVDNQLAWVYAQLAQVTTEDPTPQEPPAPGGENAPANGRSLFDGAAAVTIPADLFGSAAAYVSPADGFSIVLPATWLPLAETYGVIAASIDALREANPALATMLEEQLSTIGNLPISLVAFDLAPETLRTGFATYVSVIKQPIPAGFPLEYVVQFSADQFEQVLGLSASAESTKITLPAGETIMLDYTMANQAITRQYDLMNDQALYVVTLTAAATLADASSLQFNEIMQSFRFE